MDNKNRPHSRKKTVGSGSASVGKTGKVNTSPVGGAGSGHSGRPGGGSGGGRRGITRAAGAGGGTLALLAIAALFLFKNCGGAIDPGSLGSGYQQSSGYESVYEAPTPKPAKTEKPVEPVYTYDDIEENTDYTALAREKFYTPGKNDTATVMVYMCGTDLESKYSMATKDINEMLGAGVGDNVNLVICTGGCKKWQNNVISNSKNQIYQISGKNIYCIEKDFGTAAMTDPNNLTKFIDYCEKNYPAERNMLIFWDHGGGSVSGYGYDEKNPNASSMTLGKIGDALKKADCKFDLIGFDACLMATLETDLVCSGYADYIIASEEVEPGTGWYYTNWLSTLSKNTATPTVVLGKQIADDFVNSSCSAQRGAQVTLSLVDLAELSGTVPDALMKFASSTGELVSSDDYKRVSTARAGARQFSAQSKINQVDLIDLADRIGTNESKNLINVLSSCIKYNKSTITRSNGVSIYFPYETTKNVKSAVASMNEIADAPEYSECLGEYSKCIQSFASLEYGGQIAASATQQQGMMGSDWGGMLGSLVSSSGASGYSSTSPLSILGGLSGAGASGGAPAGFDASAITSLLGAFSGLGGRSMPENYDWVDTELIANKAEDIAEGFLDPERITATVKNGEKVLELTDEEWSLVQSVELNVFVGDGDGYIDLGLDNTFDWYDDYSILMDYDGTWLTLNGNVCAYYLVSDTQLDDGSWVTVGRIPALLNGEFVNLQVVFDEENPEGTITGAYPLYEDAGIEVQAKGDVEIKAGDKIELLCDYYDEDGEVTATYTFGTKFKVPESGLTLTNLALDTSNDALRVTYRITDIYGNHFWIEVK